MIPIADNGIFIKVLPSLELAALTSVVGQLKGLMGKAGADISKSFDGPQAALEKLNLKVVETTNKVAAQTEKLTTLQTEATRAAEKRANVETTAAERAVKANNDIIAAEEALEATRTRNYASQEARTAAVIAGVNRVEAAEMRAAQVQRDTALQAATAMDAEAAAAGRAAKANEDLAALRGVNAAATAAHADALVAGSGALSRYGGALNAVGIAATGAAALIGGAGIEAATKFETGMTRIQVAGQVSLGEVQKLQQGLLDMSTKMGESMGELQNASLMIAKAGPQYKNAADNLNILKSAIQLSKTEGADLTTVVQQMTTSMTDFNMGADSASSVATKFQIAAANAKRPLEEFVGALHNIEPAAMGVLDNKTGLDQVLTVMSQMAGTGAGIDQASQNLNNFLSHLNAPNAPQRSVLGSLGLDSTEMSKQLKQPNGLITVLGELKKAIADVTTGEGANAVTHLGAAFNNPQVTALMQQDYGKLSPFSRGIADKFVSANQAGLPVDRDTMRTMRQVAGTDSMFKDWYTKFLQTTGPSNLVKQGISPDVSPALALQLATGSQAGDRSMLGITGDPGNPKDDHWENTQKTLEAVSQGKPTPNGDIPGWSEVLKTNKQKMDELNASLKLLAIEVGQDLLPAFKSFVDTLKSVFGFLGDHRILLDGIVTTLGAMATAWVGVKTAMAFNGVFNALGTGIDLAIGKFGLMKTAAVETATTIEGTATAESLAQGKVTTAAGATSTAIAGTGTASEVAAGKIETSAAAEVAAEERVGTAATTAGTLIARAAGLVAMMAYASTQLSDWFNSEADQHPDGFGIDRDPSRRNPGRGAQNNGAGTAPDDPAWDRANNQRNGNLGGVGAHGAPGGRHPVAPGSGPLIKDPDAIAPPAPDAPAADPNTPDGTTDDPVQVQIPGFDPSSYTGGGSSYDPSSVASDMADSMGIDLNGAGGLGGMGMGGDAVNNPLTGAASGGFTLPSIARLLTTFLAEMALGNPLGHLLTGTSMFGGDQQGGSTADAMSQIADVDNMTAGQRKEKENELQIKAALMRYKKAQAAYIKAVTKYGANSYQGQTAYMNMVGAKDNIDAVTLRQTDAVQSGNAALSAAQAKVQADVANQTNITDPTKYAQDQAALSKIQNSIPTGGGSAGSGGKNSQTQDQVAMAIIQEGLKRGLSRDQIVAGLNTAKLESNYGANPLSRVQQNQNGTIVQGIFQQDLGYSGDHNDASNSAGQFFDRMIQRAHPGDSAGQQAVRVQVGKYGGGYVDSQGQGATYDRLMAQAQAPAATPSNTQGATSGILGGGGGGAGGGGGGGLLSNILNKLLVPGGAPGPDDLDQYAPGQGGLGPILKQAPATDASPPGMQATTKPGVYYSPAMKDFVNAQGVRVNPNTGKTYRLSSDPIKRAQTPTPQGAPINIGGEADKQMPPGFVPGLGPSAPGANGIGGLNAPGAIPGSNLAQAGNAAVGASRAPVPGAGLAAAGLAAGNTPAPSNTQAPTQAGSGPGATVGGGVLGMAESAAAAMAGPLAPVAQIGMSELNNVASYIGKLGGIGVEAAMETFSLHSPDGDDGGGGKSGGWIGKIAGGLAGAHPSPANSAGSTAGPVKPDSVPKDPNAQGNSGVTNNYNVTNNNHGVTDPQGVATKTNQGLMQYPTQ